jgi:hypothetical protein
MKDEDIIKLNENEIQKIERVKKAETERAEAEAHLESQRKMRILFERAPEKALPFIVYVIYMGAMAVTFLFSLLNHTGEQLYIGAVLLFVVMVAPLFVLYSESSLFKYLKNKLKRSKQE